VHSPGSDVDSDFVVSAAGLQNEMSISPFLSASLTFSFLFDFSS
jgi:hypothetical protein